MRGVNAEKGFVLNKGAQVITLIFVNDYPEKVQCLFEFFFILSSRNTSYVQAFKIEDYCNGFY